MTIYRKESNQKLKGLLLSLVLALFLIPHAVLAEVVNINKASAKALQENMVGIGPVKAKAIVDYRKKHGKFKSIDELANVPGIGQATIKQNKKNLSLSRGVTAVSQSDKSERKAATESGTSGSQNVKTKEKRDSKSSSASQDSKQSSKRSSESKRSKKDDKSKSNKNNSKDKKSKKNNTKEKKSKDKKSKDNKSKGKSSNDKNR